jgi:peptidyl-tRNA hydrolase, PTH1 family
MDKQLFIVGLGNPGKAYQHTRHNIGFDSLDLFAGKYGLVFGRTSRGAQTAEGRIRVANIALLKPMKYMNLSGEPLNNYLRQRPTPPESILVIVDDVHLPVGRIRLRPGGSDGGHNGLKSITAHLHTNDYPRLRIGVGEPEGSVEQIDHVLSRFSREEEVAVKEILAKSVEAIDTWIDEGIEPAMNRFNGL